MAASSAVLLNLSIHEARRLINRTAYQQFLKGLNRPRLCHDAHIISKPIALPKVFTCRVIGTDRYIPFNEIAMARYRLNDCQAQFRKRAVPHCVEASTQRPVDLYYDEMSTGKNNVVMVHHLLENLSYYKDVSSMDLIRLYSLGNQTGPWREYFTPNQLSKWPQLSLCIALICTYTCIHAYKYKAM